MLVVQQPLPQGLDRSWDENGRSVTQFWNLAMPNEVNLMEFFQHRAAVQLRIFNARICTHGKVEKIKRQLFIWCMI